MFDMCCPHELGQRSSRLSALVRGTIAATACGYSPTHGHSGLLTAYARRFEVLSSYAGCVTLRCCSDNRTSRRALADTCGVHRLWGHDLRSWNAAGTRWTLLGKCEPRKLCLCEPLRARSLLLGSFSDYRAALLLGSLSPHRALALPLSSYGALVSRSAHSSSLP